MARPSKIKKPLSVEVKENEILDIENFDCGSSALTIREKSFVFWYTYPSSATYLNAAGSYRKAGYKITNHNNSAVHGFHLKNKEKIQAAIKYVNDKKIKINLEEAYDKIMTYKMQRAFFDMKDFVKKIEISKYNKETETNVKEVVEVLKDLDELSEEQRHVIDGIDYKGMQGFKVYTLADRDKTMNDLLMWQSKFIDKKTDDDGFDIETTLDIIKDKLNVKIRTRKIKNELSEKAEFVETPKKIVEEL